MKEIKVTSDEALKEIEPECFTEDTIGRYRPDVQKAAMSGLSF